LDRLRKRAAEKREKKRVEMFEKMSDAEKSEYVQTLQGPTRSELRIMRRHAKREEATSTSSDGMRIKRKRTRRARNKVAARSRRVNRG